MGLANSRGLCSLLALALLSTAVPLHGQDEADLGQLLAGTQVLVVPFRNLAGGSDTNWIGEGIAEVLTTHLAPTATVMTIDRSDRSSLADALAAADALALCRRAGARWVVQGAYELLGTQIRVTASIVDCQTGGAVRSARVDGRRDELFALQDRILPALGSSASAPAVVRDSTSDVPETTAVASAPAARPVSPAPDAGLTAVEDTPPRPVLPVAESRDSAGQTAVPRQSSAELQGTISDATEGVLIGVSVVLDDGGGQVYETFTDDQGQYRFDQVAAGPHTLTASVDGFVPLSQTVDLTETGASTFDMTLELRISVDVEVSAVGAGISARRNLSSRVLTGKDIEALPSDPRLLRQRLAQMAGHIGRPGDVTFLVDGFSSRLRFPPKGTILMIQINANTFDAEFQESGQQRIEITTKPGSSEFFGETDLGFSDEALNARDPFTFTKPPQQTRTFSSYLSGPLIPDRVGFFVYVGQWEYDENATVHATALDPSTLQPLNVSTTVPTPARQTNFSVKLDQLATVNSALSVAYDQTRGTTRNQGLESGFDLAERAYDSTSREDSARVSLTSIFNDAVNELRVQFRRSVTTAGAQLLAPAVLVLDAFNGGGNQGALSRRDSLDELEIGEDLTWGYKTHVFKAGFDATLIRLRNDDRSNFGGVFTFGAGVEHDALGDVILDLSTGAPFAIDSLERYRRTVLGLPGYGPSQFTINRGSPLIGVSDRRMSWFVQDDWSFSDRVTLSAGLRQDFQSDLAQSWTLAPRLSLAFIPDEAQASTVRMGVGIFTEPVGTGVTFDTIRFDSSHQQQLVVSDPGFFPEIPADIFGELAPVSATYVKAPDVRAPHFLVSSVSYERELPAGLAASVGYVWRQGRQLLRLRNINAPLTAGGGQVPQPGVGPVLQFESTGASTSHELQLSLPSNIGAAVSSDLTYTLGSTQTDTDGAYTTPANSYDLSTERGPAADDIRHQLSAGGSITLPGGWYVSPYVFVTSAAPFNITTGFDNNSDTLFTDRPAFAREGDPNAILTPFGLLTPNPEPGDQLIPRNLGRERRLINVSLNLSKSFPVNLLDGRVRFGVDVQNLFNETLLNGYNRVLVSPVFGQPNSALNGRRINLSLSYSF